MAAFRAAVEGGAHAVETDVSNNAMALASHFHLPAPGVLTVI